MKPNRKQESRKAPGKSDKKFSAWALGQLSLLSLAVSLIAGPDVFQPVLALIGFSIIAGLATSFMIPRTGPLFISIGLKGKDMSKKVGNVLPESMGAVAALSYLFAMLIFIPFMFYQYLVTNTSGGGIRDEGFEVKREFVANYFPVSIFTAQRSKVLEGSALPLFPHNKLAEYLSALLCLQSMLLLGMADDLFDIRWRNKFFLPAIAAIPLLVVYYIDFGVTYVLIPRSLQSILFFWNPSLITGARIVDLGWLYYGYMAAVAIFCPNSINILAGVNGLEVGQSVVIAICILANDLLYLLGSHDVLSHQPHLFSIFLLLPWLGCSLAVLYFNWFPARVFVGDTYCYFSGMVFAVVGILGHFSKTLLLFFIPQTFNFLYSVPQLFKIIDCPRHRLPKFNPEDGLMYPSRTTFDVPPSRFARIMLLTLEKLHLIRLWKETVKVKDVQTGEEKSVSIIKQCSNMTLINLVIVWFGPMREDRVTQLLMLIQFVIGMTALVVRHSLSKLLFEVDNV